MPPNKEGRPCAGAASQDEQRTGSYVTPKVARGGTRRHAHGGEVAP